MEEELTKLRAYLARSIHPTVHHNLLTMGFSETTIWDAVARGDLKCRLGDYATYDIAVPRNAG